MLHEKRVCVVGCGGLGGYIIELLARAGVGALTVVDGDVFDVTNLNRQLLCEEALIGRSKAEAAARRVGQINSAVEVRAIQEFMTADNAPRLLDRCGIAVDALDSPGSRLILTRACADAGLLLVHGAIGGLFAQATVVPPGSGVMEKLYPPRAREKSAARGNLSFVAAACASVQVAEAVKLLCGRESELTGKLLLMDFKTMEFTKIEI